MIITDNICGILLTNIHSATDVSTQHNIGLFDQCNYTVRLKVTVQLLLRPITYDLATLVECGDAAR
jgi:hypothetical protein